MPTLDYIIHFTGVRVRVVGSGNLDMTLYSLDSVYSLALNSIVMATSTERFANKLANFNHPRAMLKLGTDAIDEYFSVSQITIYVKPVAASYPQ